MKIKNDFNKAYYECNVCGKTYDISESIWRCECGGVIDVKGTSLFAKDSLKERPMNFWRYAEALALSFDPPKVSLGEVMTPIVDVNFRRWNISCKLEYVLPTGSYKDRGIAVCINHLIRNGIKNVSEDSSGNAGASVSAYAAACGVNAYIFVPATTSRAKINQIEFYGAQCRLVEGTRIECAHEAQKSRDNVYYIGHSWNPLFACGVKSVAYEIAEQSNWNPPDWIVVPTGGGSLVLGLIEGFTEMLEAGYVKRTPKLLAVQSKSCAPICKAWEQSLDSVKKVCLSPTCAEGVALPDPARGTQVLNAMRSFGGCILTVDEDSIISAWRDIGKNGLFMEPTSAVAVAGAWEARANDIIGDKEQVLVVITGHGLKSKPSLMA